MIEINYRGIAYCMVVVVLLIAGLFVITANAAPANLANLTHGSYISIETTDGPVNITVADTRIVTTPSNASHYIYQGETVYLGDKLDISGVVPPYPQLAYWDGYDMYDTNPTYNITLPDRKIGYYNFTLYPAIFGTRLGNWYKYADRFERAGNNIAFVVAPRPFYNYTLTFSNGTMIYISELPEFNRASSPTPTPTPEIMPAKHVADYLVTSNDKFNITVPKLSAVWIFDGEDNSILYSVNDTPQIVFTEAQIEHLMPGDYKILIQTIGNVSKDLDVVFSNKSIKWFDRSAFEVKTVPTENLVPAEAIKYLEKIFPFTYDTYQIKTLTIQDPEITIGYMSRINVGSAKEYYKDQDARGNVSLMDVRGYTNILPGFNLSVTLDEAGKVPKDVSKLYTYNSKAQGTYLGDMRYYQVYVPLYWNDLKPGMHNLTARTELGGHAVANFPVSEDSPDSYVPPQTIRFMGDRNPWAPNLTVPAPIIKKEIITVPGPVITVIVTPSNEQVRAQQEKIIGESNAFWIPRIITAIIGLIVLLYLVSVWLRSRKK